MIKFLLLNVFFSTWAFAYVPTVESLFRHGANPEVSQNGVSLTLVVKRGLYAANPGSPISDVSLLRDQKQEDFYRLFFHKGSGENLKLSQTRYGDKSFSDSSLQHKTHYSNFGAHSIKSSVEFMERGIFMGVLTSMALNNGTMLMNYLKGLGVPVRLNSEILNRQKVEMMASYKHYLAVINRDRNARKTEANPLRPEDREARVKAEQIMNESMYADTQQVRLSREDGEMAWLISAGPFEAVLSYKERAIKRINYKSPAGDFEIVASSYWLANGTHAMPRYLKVRSINGESWVVEVKNLRHYNEREDEMVKRINRWDEQLKGKATAEPRPEFLL
jgi:hypothetical protein